MFSQEFYIKEMNNASNWMQVRKKRYQVNWCVPQIGYRVHNIFENSDCVANQNTPILITGIYGEQWTTSIECFIRTYAISPLEVHKLVNDVYSSPFENKLVGLPILKRSGSKISRPVFTKVGEDALVYFAYRVPKEYEISVRTAYGVVLTANGKWCTHGLGDFIVCSAMVGDNRTLVPNFNDKWVVNGLVFEKTYDICDFKTRRHRY